MGGGLRADGERVRLFRAPGSSPQHPRCHRSSSRRRQPLPAWWCKRFPAALVRRTWPSARRPDAKGPSHRPTRERFVNCSYLFVLSQNVGKDSVLHTPNTIKPSPHLVLVNVQAAELLELLRGSRGHSPGEGPAKGAGGAEHFFGIKLVRIFFFFFQILWRRRDLFLQLLSPSTFTTTRGALALAHTTIRM